MPVMPQAYPAWPLLAIAMIGAVIIFGGIAANAAICAWWAIRKPSWAGLSAAIEKRPWTWRDVAHIALTILVLHMLLLVLLQLRYRYDPEPGHSFLALSIAAQTLIFHGIGYVMVARRLRTRGVTFSEAFGLAPQRFWSDLGKGVTCYLAAMPYVLVAALFYRLFLFLIDYEVKPQDVVEIFGSPEYPLYLKLYLGFLAVAVAPVAEEMLFRGVALPALARHSRILPGILLVSGLFALIHFSMPAIVPLFVVATGFALAYVLSGSLLVSIVMHMTFNSVTLLLIMLSTTMPQNPFL